MIQGSFWNQELNNVDKNLNFVGVLLNIFKV
jgi:hypothetical protein